MSGGGVATGRSSLGLWCADSGDPSALLGPGGGRDLGSRTLGPWTGSGGRRSQGRRRPRGRMQGWECLSTRLLRPKSCEREKFPGCSPLARVGPQMSFTLVGGPGPIWGPALKPPDFGGQPGNYAWRAGCGCGPGAERRAAAGGREAGEATCQRVCVVAGLGSLHLALPSARGLGRAGLQRASPRTPGDGVGLWGGGRSAEARQPRLVSKVENWLQIP